MRALLSLTVLLLLLWPAGLLPAQERTDLLDVRLTQWERTLDEIDRQAGAAGLSERDLESLRERLARLRADIAAASAEVDAATAPLNRQLDALGPVPEEGAPPEAPSVAAERERLDQAIGRLEGQVKQAGVIVARSQDLDQRLAKQARELRVAWLLERRPLPLAPATVGRALPELARHLGSLAEAPAQWWLQLSPAQQQDALLYRFALVLVVAVALGLVTRRLLLSRFGRDPTIAEPSYARRLVAAGVTALAEGLIPALIFGGILYRAREADSLVTGLFADMVTTFCEVMIFFVLVRAAARAGLAPHHPNWRLETFAPDNARVLARRIVILAGVFALDVFLSGATSGLDVSVELESLFRSVTVIAEAALVISLMPGRLWAREPETAAEAAATAAAAEAEGQPADARAPSHFWMLLRLVVVLVAAASIVAVLLGYSALGARLIKGVVISGALVGGLYLLRGLFRELIGGALRTDFVQDKLALGRPTRNLIKFWSRALLDLLALLVGIVLLLLIWGVPLVDLQSWVRDAIQGFRIGNVTISLADIFAGLVVFAVALLLTRMLQRLLTEKVLPQTNLDTGVQHSLAAGLGYVGVALAAALAISTVGLDLSNLAIIAGALSVGIGFGLQNVVNNFVSGLILLIERPIKVGDWIIASGHEGYVRRINVRATELETFQRASVIIPNSELISSSVINWTHKNKLGRVEVPVGVAYGSDVDLVMETLMACMRADQRILNWPEPYVLFRGFGDSSLDFEARGYIGDVEWVIIISSDLRVAISRAFAEKGIEIPFPQRDLHLRDIDRLVGAMGGEPAEDPPEAPAAESGAPRTTSRPIAGETGAAEGEGDS